MSKTETVLLVVGGGYRHLPPLWTQQDWKNRDAFRRDKGPGKVMALPRARRNLPAGVRNRYGKEEA